MQAPVQLAGHENYEHWQRGYGSDLDFSEFLGDLVALLILDCIQESKPSRQFKIGDLARFFREHS